MSAFLTIASVHRGGVYERKRVRDGLGSAGAADERGRINKRSRIALEPALLLHPAATSLDTAISAPPSAHSVSSQRRSSPRFGTAAPVPSAVTLTTVATKGGRGLPSMKDKAALIPHADSGGVERAPRRSSRSPVSRSDSGAASPLSGAAKAAVQRRLTAALDGVAAVAAPDPAHGAPKRANKGGQAQARALDPLAVLAALEAVCVATPEQVKAFRVLVQQLQPLLAASSEAIAEFAEQLISAAAAQSLLSTREMERLIAQVAALGPRGWLDCSQVPAAARRTGRSTCQACGQEGVLRTMCSGCLSASVVPRASDIDWRRVRAHRTRMAASLAQLEEQQRQKAAQRAARKAGKNSAFLEDEGDEVGPPSFPRGQSAPRRSASVSSGASSPSSSPSPRRSAAACAAESSTPPSSAELLAWREEAVLRSLAWSGQFVQRSREADFSGNGGDVVFLYRFIITRCSGRVRDAAVRCVDVMMDKWERSELSILDAYPEADRLQNFTECLHAQRALALVPDSRHRKDDAALLRMEGKVAAALSRHAVDDICRFNPTAGGPLLPPSQAGYCMQCGCYQLVQLRSCPACSSALTHPPDLDALCESIVWTSVYRDVGLHPLQCCDAAVFMDAPLRFVRQVRPYRALRELSGDQFRFQCYLVTHLIFITSTHDACWYAAQLSRRTFLEEFLFLHANVDVVLAMDDPELVGEFAAALRVLGCSDEDDVLRRAYAYLLQKENTGKAAGSWVRSSDSFYKRYHAAYCAIIGLAQLQSDVEASLPCEWETFFE